VEKQHLQDLVETFGVRIVKQDIGNFIRFLSKKENIMPEKKHSFIFNPEDRGGELLILTTTFVVDENDPAKATISQELKLQSYYNSASFDLYGMMTPEKLRKLASELEKAKMEFVFSNVEKIQNNS